MADYYNTLYRLWAVMALGPSTRLMAETEAHFSSPEEMYLSLTNKEGPAAAVKAAADISLNSAEKIMEYCDKQGIMLAAREDDIFPKRLLSLSTCPSLLFYRGDISDIDNRLSIAVVGSRKPSDYSRKIASSIVNTLSSRSFDIVSGFAEGIDICAHMTAVKNGARTFAVLGCGLDTKYPAANMKYRKYIEENGAVISEYLPSAAPLPSNFPHRNRIIAGLSLGAAVIEAGKKSGSLNTASHCSEQGKPVFVVPTHDILDERYKGNSELIRQGAVPLMGARDIYSEYCSSMPHTIVENNAVAQKLDELKKLCEESISSGKTAESSKKKAKSVSAKESEETIPVSETPFPTISAEASEEEKAVLDALMKSKAPLSADDIAQICGADIGDVLTALTGMEIDGAVLSENGKYRIS